MKTKKQKHVLMPTFNFRYNLYDKVLVETSNFSRHPKEISNVLRALYTSRDSKVKAWGSILNSVLTQRSLYFLLSRNILSDLIVADKKNKGGAISGETYANIRTKLCEGGFLSVVKTGTSFDKLNQDVKRKATIYTLGPKAQSIIDYLESLEPFGFFDQQKESIISYFNESESNDISALHETEKVPSKPSPSSPSIDQETKDFIIELGEVLPKSDFEKSLILNCKAVLENGGSITQAQRQKLNIILQTSNKDTAKVSKREKEKLISQILNLSIENKVNSVQSYIRKTYKKVLGREMDIQLLPGKYKAGYDKSDDWVPMILQNGSEFWQMDSKGIWLVESFKRSQGAGNDVYVLSDSFIPWGTKTEEIIVDIMSGDQKVLILADAGNELAVSGPKLEEPKEFKLELLQKETETSYSLTEGLLEGPLPEPYIDSEGVHWPQPLGIPKEEWRTRFLEGRRDEIEGTLRKMQPENRQRYEKDSEEILKKAYEYLAHLESLKSKGIDHVE